MTDANVSFVRTEQIPPSPPPTTQSGVVKWARENLFSSVFNTVLTIVALYIVLRLAIGVAPWFYNGVWSAESMRDCRDTLDGVTGACFAVLVDRWDHLVFGFKYPPDGYWRIALTVILLLVAMLPVLFTAIPNRVAILLGGVGAFVALAIIFSAPIWLSLAVLVVFIVAASFVPEAEINVTRKLLMFTAIYPFLAYWLVWGGTIWSPITLMALIVLTVMVFRLMARQIEVDLRRVVAAVIGLICGAGLAYLLYIGAKELLFIADSVGNGSGFVSTIAQGAFWIMAIFTFVFFIPMGIFVAYAIYSSYEDGGLVSLVTAFLFIALALTFVFGGVVGFMSGIIPIELPAVASRDLGGFALNMILGTVCVSLSIPLGIALALGRQSNMPLIKGVCVIFIEFIRGVPLITLLFVANVMLAYFMPPESNFDLILRVIIMITMFSAAYIAEVIRGGLAALPKGQYEAADSLGLDYTQATQLIILPQALKISIPGIVNVAVGLFKDTTLVSIISMFDLVGMIRGPIQNSTEWIGVYWEVYGFGALLFFVVCYSISQYSQWLERQLQTDHH